MSPSFHCGRRILRIIPSKTISEWPNPKGIVKGHIKLVASPCVILENKADFIKERTLSTQWTLNKFSIQFNWKVVQSSVNGLNNALNIFREDKRSIRNVGKIWDTPVLETFCFWSFWSLSLWLLWSIIIMIVIAIILYDMGVFYSLFYAYGLMISLMWLLQSLLYSENWAFGLQRVNLWGTVLQSTEQLFFVTKGHGKTLKTYWSPLFGGMVS